MRHCLVTLALGSLLTNSAAIARDVHASVLTPSAPWEIHYGEDSCRLARVFGSGDERVAFYLEKYGIGSNFTILMAGKPLKHLARSDSLIRFSNGGGAGELTAGEFGKFGPSVLATSGTLNPRELADDQLQKKLRASAGADYQSSDEGEDPNRWQLTPDQMHSITWVEISRREDSVRLSTGPLDKPMEALAKCVDDLVKTWGLDPAEIRAIAQSAKPDSESIQSVAHAIQQHYPISARMRGEQATLLVRLTIDTAGHVEACQITHITEAIDFDDFACKVFKKSGKFTPALDANGNPTKSIYRTRVAYRMP